MSARSLPPPLGLGAAGLGLAALLALAAGLPVRDAIPTALPLILCSTPDAGAARPALVVTVLQSEPLAGMPGKRMTTQLVRLPPRGYSPSHVHGGDLTAYVVKGTVRSQHAGLPAGDFHVGDVFYEPQGTTHVFIENPSADEWAEIIAVMVHDEGAPLTTFLN